MTPDAHEYNIRTMTPADLAAACELSALVDWNQTPAGWRRILDFQPDGCFVAERGGRICGTVTTIEYAGRFGWVGMMLVHPDCRRQGVGRALLRHAIDYLRSVPTETVKLDATDLGRKLYDSLGFRPEYALQRWGGAAPHSREQAPRATQRDLDDIAALDLIAFGADRRRVLARLMADHADHAWILRDDAGTLLGYTMARPGRKAWQIGPTVARDSDAARPLLAAAMAALAGDDVLIDIIADSPVAAELERFGLRPLRSLTRMFLGPNRHPGRPAMSATIGAFEKG